MNAVRRMTRWENHRRCRSVFGAFEYNNVKNALRNVFLCSRRSRFVMEWMNAVYGILGEHTLSRQKEIDWAHTRHHRLWNIYVLSPEFCKWMWARQKKRFWIKLVYRIYTYRYWITESNSTTVMIRFSRCLRAVVVRCTVASLLLNIFIHITFATQ